MQEILRKPHVQAGIYLFSGLIFGTMLLKILNFPGRWSKVLVVIPFIIPVLLNIKNLKRFLLGILVLSFSMDINFTFFRTFANQAGSHQYSLGVGDIVLFLLYFLWINEQLSKRNFRVKIFPSTTLSLLLFIIFSLLTTQWAPRPELVWFEVVQLLRMFLLYFYIINNIKNEDELKLVLWFLVLSVFIQSGIGFFQKITGRFLGLDMFGELWKSTASLGRVGGTLGHANKLAMFLELLLPVVLCFLFLVRNNLSRVIVGAAFAFGMILLIFTGSRGGFVSLSIALPLTIFLMYRKGLLRLGSIIGVFVSITLFVVAVVLPMKEQIVARVSSKVGRLEMIEVAASVIKEHPFLGVGLNNYQERMQEFDRTYIRTTFHFPRPVHNLYFLIAAETGIIGLTLFIWFMISLLVVAFKNFKRSTFFFAILNAGIIAGVIAFLIHGLADKHLPSESPLFFFLAAIAVGSSRSRTTSPIEKDSVTTENRLEPQF